MVREVWLPVPDYVGTYDVSNLGRVKRLSSGRILVASFSRGYPHVSLSQEGVITTHRVHVVMLTAFCGPAPFDNMEACHNDGDPSNCILTNVRWGYRADNREDMVRHGTQVRGERVFGAKLTEPEIVAIRRRADRGELNPSIADDYGVSISTIHLIRHRAIWKHVPEEQVNAER